MLGFAGGSVIKNPPEMQEVQGTWVRSLGREDPLEEVMATHSSILAWRVSQTERRGGLQSMVSQIDGHKRSNSACTHTGMSVQRLHNYLISLF